MHRIPRISLLPNALALVCVLCCMGIARCENDSALVANLRSKLKYKFALDFLVQRKPHLERFGTDTEMIQDMAQNAEYFRVVDTSDSTAEEFFYYDDYEVRKVPSFDEPALSYFIIFNAFDTRSIFLLADDTSHAVLLDTFPVNSVEGPDLDVISFNGKSILKLERTAYSLDRYIKQGCLLAIIDHRFRRLYTTTEMEVYMADSVSDPDIGGRVNTGNYIRSMANYRFIDLDGDGFLDLVEETRKDIVNMDNADDDFERATVIKHISSAEERFLWDPASNSFYMSK